VMLESPSSVVAADSPGVRASASISEEAVLCDASKKNATCRTPYETQGFTGASTGVA
jgi:hypothetical protein